MKPTGDCLLDVDFAQIWADIDDPDGVPFIRSCCSDSTEFKKRLRQLSPRVRDSLHAAWFLQFTPRDDGGRGLYVTDDLWYVWMQHVENGAELGTLLKLGTIRCDTLPNSTSHYSQFNPVTTPPKPSVD
jgi:hypothetical protein